MVSHFVVLVGGLGSRLGEATRSTPKPLLDVGGRPFVEYLISEAARRGFSKLTLLAGRHADKVQAFVRDSAVAQRYQITVQTIVEPAPLGTGGALMNAADMLDDEFLLANGDSWFDFNWLDLMARTRAAGFPAGVALRRIGVADRYETLEIDGSRISSIHARDTSARNALINGGVYYFTRAAFEGLDDVRSIENDLLPRLVDRHFLAGFEYPGFFIDIGIPDTLAEARTTVAAQRLRPAVFLDRDGVLNVDHGYVHRPEDFTWIEGAKQAVKMLNDLGYYVFVVTNQAGIARGYFDVGQFQQMQKWISNELRAEGAYLDDWRYCPYHRDGVVEKFRGDHPWRKPSGGMIADLFAHWPIAAQGSFLIGDKPSDIAAADANRVPGFLFHGGDLKQFVSEIIDRRPPVAATR
jgi:D-glycero-D-manno-heptose 1,7-bisphosphate phosphatase